MNALQAMLIAFVVGAVGFFIVLFVVFLLAVFVFPVLYGVFGMLMA